jgi:4-hydroxybenzoate polyprenyltransferase
MNYLHLIRYKNLLLIAFMQILFRYGYLALQNIPLALNDWQYGCLIFATLCIAAGGFVVNDIMDQETDAENKPHRTIVGKRITETRAYNLYFALNFLGVVIGFYLANQIEKPNFAVVFIGVSALLYLYATSFKQSLLIGNIIVAILLSLSVIIVGIFDLYPVINQENKVQMGILFAILLDYALFAFIINLIREIIKDLEDVEGDYNSGMNTLPIAIGIPKTTKLVMSICLLSIIMLLWYIDNHLMSNKLYFATIYSLLFVVSPLLFVTIKLWNANKKNQFSLMSLMLKWTIFFGILSILVINLNIKHNA